jgi:uncharacterized protein (DUF2236 family)
MQSKFSLPRDRKDMTYDPRGLYNPDSIVWKIHSDPSMVVGGIRALFQQALHPVAMAGVATHSNFREDAWGRLQRTGDYVATLTFGSTEQAQELTQRVRRVHTKLGLDNPHELLWVHMAMVDSFLDIAFRSGMALTPSQKDEYVAEMVEFAVLVGVTRSDVPKSYQELKDYFQKIAPELVASDDAKRAAIFLTLPPLPTVIRFATPAAPAWAALSALAAASLPRWARNLYGWPTLPAQELATNLSLLVTRRSLSLIPSSFIAPPIFNEGIKRWHDQSVSA